MSQNAQKIRIGITQGDVNGVGVEVIIKALANPDILDLFTPVIFGHSEIFRKVAKDLGEEDFQINIVQDYSGIKDGKINFIEVSNPEPERLAGTPSKETGKAAVAALEAVSDAIERGELDLLVTAPIDKNSVQGENFNFPGHTEYLEEKFAVSGGKALMILAKGNLRVALVTTHLPLTEVPSKIVKEDIEEAIKAFNSALRMDFGCERPKIAVLSLNPHCGDGGVLGKEEQEQILPAVEQCRSEGIMAFGPMAADGLFGSGMYTNFDGILAMYHDQGLAPFKAIASGGGVNFTAGLNVIRTSPAHGTAYDIAGKGIADETSMREAIYAAIDIARRRDSYLDASENPLPIKERVQQKKAKDRKEEDKLPLEEDKDTEE